MDYKLQTQNHKPLVANEGEPAFEEDYSRTNLYSLSLSSFFLRSIISVYPFGWTSSEKGIACAVYLSTIPFTSFIANTLRQGICSFFISIFQASTVPCSSNET